jgi:hypothetical protein
MADHHEGGWHDSSFATVFCCYVLRLKGCATFLISVADWHTAASTACQSNCNYTPLQTNLACAAIGLEALVNNSIGQQLQCHAAKSSLVFVRHTRW